jgi:hypothetical protein
MKQKLTNFLVILGIMSAALVFVAPAGPVGATAKSDVCSGIALTGGNCNAGGEKPLTDTIANVINILSSIVGFVAVVMIIVGGFKYITSNGDAAGIASAKHTVIYAIVGLLLVAMAQLIVRFVLNATPK